MIVYTSFYKGHDTYMIIYKYNYLYLYTLIHTHIHTHTHTHTHTLTHKQTDTYIYIYIYIYRTSCAQVHELPQSHCGHNWEGTLFS